MRERVHYGKEFPMTELLTVRPRRSCLYMPADKPRALEKAQALPADCVIIDLEDAVSPATKVAARAQLCDFLKSANYGQRELVIRINSLSSPWGHDDLEAVLALQPDALLVPKIESVDAIAEVYTAIDRAEATDQVAIWAMIETPLGVLKCAELAERGRDFNLEAFVVGTNDLAKDMHLVPTADRQCFSYALSAIVTAARAYGIAPIDGVFNDIADEQGLLKECQQGVDYGFDGKTVIHPSQLDGANAAFSPRSADVDTAKVIVAAFGLPENADKGVISLNGKMVELLHLRQAQRLLAVQEKIDALSMPSE